MKAVSRHCAPCPREAGRPAWTASSCKPWGEHCCKARRHTVLAPSCGRSSGRAFSSRDCTGSSSARHKSGASSAPWGFRHRSPSAAPLSVTKRPCRPGSERLGLGSKKTKREGRLIVFIDESGLSERPTRVRTWAPKGQTPIIQFHFNWTHISVIAGLSRTNCLFRMYEGSIKKEQHVEFLKALRAHLKQPLLIIWDGLKAHRSKLVREYLDSTDGEVQMAFLPPYSPDLNPVEFLWAWLKRHALANFCPANLHALNATARNKLKSAQHRPSIIAACWTQAGLW